MTWPLAVMALPGNKVWVPITKPDAVLPVMLVPSMTTTAGAGAALVPAEGGDTDCGGAGLRIIAPPEAAADTCCPFTVMAEPGIKV